MPIRRPRQLVISIFLLAGILLGGDCLADRQARSRALNAAAMYSASSAAPVVDNDFSSDPNLVFWVRGSYGVWEDLARTTAATDDLDTLRAVDDGSDNGYNVQALAGTSTKLRLGPANGLQQDHIQFGGNVLTPTSGDTSVLDFTTASPRTVFFRFAMTSWTGTNFLITKTNGTTGWELSAYEFGGFHILSYGLRNTGAYRFSEKTGPWAGNQAIEAWVRDDGSGTAAGIKWRIDREEVTEELATSGSIGEIANSFLLTIFGRNSVPSGPGAPRIEEIAVFNGEKSVSEIEEYEETVLSDRYFENFPSWEDTGDNWTQFAEAFNDRQPTAAANTTETTSTFGTVVGASQYYGGVMASNQVIYAIPFAATSIGKINTLTDTYTTFGSATSYYPGCLSPQGNVYAFPSGAGNILKIVPGPDTVSTVSSGIGADATLGCTTANNGYIYSAPYFGTVIYKLDPATDTLSSFGSFAGGVYKYMGCVNAPNGYIYCVPHTATDVLKINPTNDTYTTICSFGAGAAKWNAPSIAPNNEDIYAFPYSETSILKIDTSADTCSTFGSVTGPFLGSSVSANGKIYGIPGGAGVIGVVDPYTDTYSTFGAGLEVFAGGNLAANGSIYAVPTTATSVLKILSSTVPVHQDMYLYKSLNKF